jgi:hypothetical protein
MQKTVSFACTFVDRCKLEIYASKWMRDCGTNTEFIALLIMGLLGRTIMLLETT